MATTINYDDAAFRAQFLAFSDRSCFSPASLQVTWNTATIYINNQYGGCYCGGMSLAQQTQALNLMTAHLAAITALIQGGNAPGVVTGATVDKVSVTIEPPPAKNSWQYWLQTTPYGQQLLALLQLVGVGGMYFGGRSELSGFRRAGGYGCW